MATRMIVVELAGKTSCRDDRVVTEAGQGWDLP